ncbi:MAG: hypothetical protein ACM3H7_00600 [Acidobacteriaceae bacterium]
MNFVSPYPWAVLIMGVQLVVKGPTAGAAALAGTISCRGWNTLR